MGSRQRAPATCHEAESPLSRRHGSLSVRHAFERPRRGRGPGPRVESRCPRAPGAAGSGGRRGGLSFQRRVAAAHPRMPRSSDTLQPEIGLAVGSDRRRGAHTWGDAEQEPRRGLKGRGSQKSSARGSGPRSEDQRPGAQPPAFSGAGAALSKETCGQRHLSAVTGGKRIIFTSTEKALATPEL